MNDCQRIKSLLPLSAGGELGSADIVLVRRHLSGCRDCREEEAIFIRVISLARSHAPSEHQLPPALRRRVALEASARAGRRPRFWSVPMPVFAAAPGRPGLLGAVAAVMLALVALPVLLRDRSSPPSQRGREVTTIQVISEDGLVRLAWSNGQKESYTVYKGADPKDLSRSEAHVVTGNIWTDTEPEISPIVFYKVE